jgi:hypothetical protein
MQKSWGMGLFGLSTLTIAGRTKEIGIRKVLGAPMYKVFFLLSKDFIRLVLLGTLLVLPSTYLVLEHWLETFAYRITLGPMVFILTTPNPSPLTPYIPAHVLQYFKINKEPVLPIPGCGPATMNSKRIDKP